MSQCRELLPPEQVLQLKRTVLFVLHFGDGTLCGDPWMCCAGQRHGKLIVRFCLLPLHGLPRFSPGADQGLLFRHIVCNHLAEPLQVVARDSCIHVVFCMIVHTPIEEFEEGIETDGSGTKPEIQDVVPEPPCWAKLTK